MSVYRDNGHLRDRVSSWCHTHFHIHIHTQTYHNGHFTMNFRCNHSKRQSFPKSNKAFFVDFVQHSKYLYLREFWGQLTLSLSLRPAQLDIYFRLFVFTVRAVMSVCVRAYTQVCLGVSIYFRSSSSSSNFTCLLRIIASYLNH